MSKQRRPYEDTSVPVHQSQADIKKLLTRCGGTGVAFVSQPPSEAFEAMVPIEGVTYRIRVGAQVPAESRDAEQDVRRIWRVLFFHLKAVFEASASGVLEFREMMLPYIVTKGGKTIGQHILPNLSTAVEGRPERLLPGGKD
jgi:hypothetical protein